MIVSTRSGQALASLRILLIVLPCFLMYGYDQAGLGGVLAFRSFTKSFPRIDTVNTKGNQQADNARLTTVETGTIVALYTLGCVFGSLGITQLGNRIGRKKSLLAASTVTVIGAIIQTTSFSLGQLIVGRLISGLGVGAMNVVVPIWQSECTSARSRGMNVVVVAIFIASGIAISAWVNFGLSFVDENSVSWRLPLAMPGFFALTVFCLTPLFPESPRWLASKHRLAEAKDSLRIIAGTDHKDEVAIESQLKRIVESREKEASNQRGFADLFRPSKERLFYRTCLAIFVNFGAQMAGPAVISYYGTTIFRDSLGLPSHQASLLNAGVLTWKIVAALIPFFTVDRVGRRPLFMISSAGMSLAMIGLAVSVAYIERRAASVVATFLLFFYMTFFPIGFLGANFLYSSEISPQDLRVHLSAVGTATHWLFNFVVAEITPISFVTIGWKYYIVYASVSAFVIPVVYFFFPETKGRSLEEMGDMFSSPKHWYEVTGLAKQQPPSYFEGHPVLSLDDEIAAKESSEKESAVAVDVSAQETRP
ncbi:sugar transporter [Thozetella sp. PMI_491]|nr:sugar transporter [Thozetella sp. PMI_491]